MRGEGYSIAQLELRPWVHPMIYNQIIMNHYYHAIFLIIIVTSIPTHDSCTNYYDKSNPPATFCEDQECYFSEGLEYIVDDISTEKEFILCLILPSYNVTVYN
jgi:hypothetical protein